ncbi:ABC transporter permease [Nitratireductor aquimarinus]|uniref:ABC transporter permease n=1 Tax=Nitratireductor TaxID=245876 RepID=UPI0019D3B041|nr:MULTISPECIES: ABC transporter permease [Nitratireductor]MBN7777452.1 ABC transporter permease [Nitratireductor pacificus]MBN7781445.1 ABC transporter permease [Nitratireductor pacificus]MBN7790251.1 ABC transporter permease [Nitratireductor aquimarinus]MBY6099661.1 ABC transporter permease [Nitratireductor aquimarinus]MCA1261756.1 ABC transporter permease [Nitratireductor aquimarinus]
MKSLFVALQKYREIWLFLAVQDVKSRFRRSYLGVFWMVAHQLTFALGGGLIWSAIFGTDPATFIPSIASGFAIWGFIASSFVDGSNAFVVSQGYIRQVSMPVQIFILRHWATSLVTLLVGTSTAIALALVLGGPQVLLGLPAFLLGAILLALCMLMVSAAMSYLGVVYGDVTHALAGIFQMLFVVSPVIYPPQVLEDRGLGWFVAINPFASMIEVVRVPILEQNMAQPFNYAVVIGVMVVFAAIYALLDARLGRRIIFYI